MTQSPLPSVPTPPAPKSSNQNRNSWIAAALVIGLLIGLVLGIFISPNLLPKQNGTGTNNQVQVSGTISENQPSEIYFYSTSSVNGSSIQTSGPVTNGQYSVVLVGGLSYSVTVSFTDTYGNSEENSYTIYVPSGVTTFTANF